MGRFDKLPGVSGENTRRRNVIVGGAYALAGCVALGAVAPESEDGDADPEAATGENSDGDGNGNGETTEPESTDDGSSSEQEQRDEPAEQPEAIEHNFSGSGSDVLGPFEIEQAGPTIVAMRHEGSSNFQVEVLDAQGELVELVANAIGSWGGANVADTVPGEHRLDVEADGDWEITVTDQPEYSADQVSNDFPATLEGTSDNVYGPVDFSSARTISWACEGDENNIILVREANGSHGDLVLNEIGPDEGAGVASTLSGVGWIDVEMSGSYSVQIEE